MTSLRHVLGLTMRRRCCLRHFLLIVPLLWLPRLVSYHSSSTLLLPWDVPPPWRMKLQRVSLVAAFLLGVSPAACTRLPPMESVLAGLRLPARSSVHSWLLCLRSGPLSAPALLPAPNPVLHMSAPVRMDAVADARLGLA